MERSLNYSQREEILGTVSARVESCLRSLGQSTDEWQSNFRASSGEILATASREEFEARVNQLLRTLRLSHVGFEHVDLERCSAGRAICATYSAFEIDNHEHWIFQDVHEDGPAHKAGIRPGDVFLAVGSASFNPPDHPRFKIPSTTGVLVRTGSDHQIVKNVTIFPPRSHLPMPASKTPPAFTVPQTVVHGRMLTHEVGYVKVAMFPGNIGIDVANAMEAAVKELGSANRLIIDVRGNGGGGVGFLRLLDLLTSDNHEVGTFFNSPRNRCEPPNVHDFFVLDKIPRYKIQLLSLSLRFFWHSVLCKLRRGHVCVRLETRGIGARPFHGRVVILANRHTASASEMFVACAKEQKLATVVGEPTAGRVRGGAKAKLPHGFQLMLPSGEYKTSHGTTLEGSPIIPDVSIAFDPYSARTGRDVQLERAIEIVSDL